MEAPLFLGKDIAQGTRSHYKFPELKVDEMEGEEQGGAVIALGSKLAERVDACDTLLLPPSLSSTSLYERSLVQYLQDEYDVGTRR